MAEINKLVLQMGSHLADYPDLPQEVEEEEDADAMNDQVNLQELADDNEYAMNLGQRAAYNQIKMAILNPGAERLSTLMDWVASLFYIIILL